MTLIAWMPRYIELKIKSTRNLYISISPKMNTFRLKSRKKNQKEETSKNQTLVETLLHHLVMSLSTKSLKRNSI